MVLVLNRPLPSTAPTMASTLRKFSVAFNKVSRNFKASPADPTAMLADFVSSTKKNYLEAIQEVPSRGGEWTVVMGNESCGNNIHISCYVIKPFTIFCSCRLGQYSQFYSLCLGRVGGP